MASGLSLFVILWKLLVQSVRAYSTQDADSQFDDYSAGVITRDVCIVGGGSSGTYAAIRLQEMGKSIVLIEKKDVLGGHTNTYHDPTTNATIDYGVSLFHNIDIVKKYFAKLDLPLAKTFPGGIKSLPIDFRTGNVLKDYIDPTTNATAFQQAFASYAAQVAKYPRLPEGFYLPDPVPEDLLIPFGDFVKKYSLGAIAYTISNNAQGFGDFLSQPTLYVLKYFSPRFLEDIQTGFLTTPAGNNGALYTQALKKLNPNVLLQSHINTMVRSASDDYIRLIATTPTGRKLIRTKRLLVTIPPRLSNMAGFDLTPREEALFGQFRAAGYYTGILRNTGLSSDSQYNNLAPNTSYNLPVLPAIYNIIPTKVPGHFTMTFGAPNSSMSLVQVMDAALQQVRRVAHANGANTTANPEFVAFDDHSPYELTVSTDAIRAGFYRELYTLQGEQRTWYSGAAFQMHDSGLLWNFTEALLPRVVEGI